MTLNAQISAQNTKVLQAIADVERCRITSPIDGVIESVDVEIGENIQPGQRVVRVINPDLIEVAVRVPGQARDSLRVGDDVVLRAGPTRRWNATLSRIAPVDDETTRTLTVYVDLDAGDTGGSVPAPGTFLTARLTPALARTATVVPRRSLVNGRIYLVQDDLVEPVKVRTLFEIDRQLPSFGLPDQRWVVLEEALQDEINRTGVERVRAKKKFK